MPRTGSIASNVGPAVTSTRLPASTFGCARSDERGEERLGLEHASVADSRCTRARRVSGPENRRRRRLRAARRCAASPRCAHICPFIAGATSSGHSRARHSVDSRSSARAVRELREEVRRGRRDDDGVGAARNVDVAHRVVGAGLPQVGQHRPSGQRLERHRRDEARRGLGHHHVDDDAGLDEQARELRGLVRGDAAGHAEHDARARD